MTGSNYWLVLGPVVIAAAIAFWIAFTLYGARRRKIGPPEDLHKRGPVSGGTIEGSPVQRNSGSDVER